MSTHANVYQYSILWSCRRSPSLFIRRYMAEILPIRRKTRSNQSINQSLHSMNIDHPYILDILYNYHYVSNQSKIVNICRIPSHTEADMAAKYALEFEIVNFKIPSTDFKHFIKLSLWQIFWNFCDSSKLYSIQNKVNIPYNFNLNRSDQVVISRIRIGHSKLTHTYLFKGNDLSAYFVIVLWLYIIYFWSVLTPYPPGTYFLITHRLCKSFLHRLISVIFCNFCRSVIFTTKFKDFFFTLLHFIYFYLNFYVRRMGR